MKIIAENEISIKFIGLMSEPQNASGLSSQEIQLFNAFKKNQQGELCVESLEDTFETYCDITQSLCECINVLTLGV